MNDRDKELAKQAWTENDWDGHVDIPKLIQLIRADELEACAKVCEDEAWRLKKLAVDTGSSSTNTKAIQASNNADAIRARGNT